MPLTQSDIDLMHKYNCYKSERKVTIQIDHEGQPDFSIGYNQIKENANKLIAAGCDEERISINGEFYHTGYDQEVECSGIYMEGYRDITEEEHSIALKQALKLQETETKKKTETVEKERVELERLMKKFNIKAAE